MGKPKKIRGNARLEKLYHKGSALSGTKFEWRLGAIDPVVSLITRSRCRLSMVELNAGIKKCRGFGENRQVFFIFLKARAAGNRSNPFANATRKR